MESSQRSEIAIEILKATGDGNWLRPYQLQLVEMAVNDVLSEDGWRLFELLRSVVKEGNYHRYATLENLVAKLNQPELPTPIPALHGVEHLDYDNQGYIYWKGTLVEHYDHPLSPKMAKSAIEVGERCRHLEAIGVPVDMKTVIWYWDWFKGMQPDCPYKPIMALCPLLYEHKDGRQAAIVLKEVAYHYDGRQWWEHRRQQQADPWSRDEWDWCETAADPDRPIETLERRGFLWADAGQGKNKGCIYAKTEAIVDWLRRFNTPTDFNANDDRVRA